MKTKSEILQFNKLCAEFLGYLQHGNLIVVANIPVHVSNGKYHSDWNCIMEVVEAIEKLEKTNVYFSKTYLGEYTIEITHNEGIREYLNKTKKVFVRSSSKKEAVVQAINQFLIWHKANK